MIGDETAIAVRRGNKIVTVLAWRGLTEDAIVAHTLALLAEHRRPRDSRPRVAIDCEGGIGTRFLEKLRTYAKDFDLVPVRSGQKFWGSPEYHLIRDGLWGMAAKWMLAGGAIPTDVKLAQELNSTSFVADPAQRYRATDKKILRKELGRSPDRADAVCLAIWGFTADGEDVAESEPARPAQHDAYLEPRSRGIDPYGALDAWSGSGR